MLLSFVVPAYNEEAYLGACLDSILHQIGLSTKKRQTPNSPASAMTISGARGPGLRYTIW